MAWRKRFAALQELHHIMTQIDAVVESLADKDVAV
jgi:hypothetical protein